MNSIELFDHYKDTARQYGDREEFNKWVDWEDELEKVLELYGVPTEDGEPLTEKQAAVLNEFLDKAWNESRKERIRIEELYQNDDLIQFLLQFDGKLKNIRTTANDLANELWEDMIDRNGDYSFAVWDECRRSMGPSVWVEYLTSYPCSRLNN